MPSRKLIALSAIVLAGCNCPPDQPVCVSYHYVPHTGTKTRGDYRAECDRWVVPVHNKERDVAEE